MLNYKDLDTSACEFVEVCSVSELAETGRLFLEIDGLPIVLLNVNDEIYAIGDVCSHDNGPLGDGEIDGHCIICPRHGARFDLNSGKALTLPAIIDIPAYPVRLQGDKIEVGIPKD